MMKKDQPKILLTTLNSKYIHLNLAIRILYDLNHEKGNLDWFEFTIKSSKEEIIEKCRDYDIICFSCYIWNITETLAAAEAIKEACPDIKILLGGPEVSYEWESVIANDAIDYIIAGEGEIPFAEFMDAYPNIEQVPNLIYKNDRYEIHYNKQQVQFDVALLADRNPYQYDPIEDLYNKVAYIETSRGCPYKCEFCLASLDNKVRYLPMDTIKSNLQYLMDHGKTIKFLDRTFNIKKDFTIDLFDFILKNRSPENVFQFEITADIVHKDIIAYINEHVPPNIFRFEIGIQTTNQESNREVGRRQNFTKTSDVINQIKDKVVMHLDLIVGLPLETYDMLKESFENTFLLYPPELQLGFLKFLKGTPLREKYPNYGYDFDPNPPYEVIRSDFMSEKELELSRMVERGLEIYWNKRRAFNTLTYVSQQYSIFDFLKDLAIHFGQQYHYHKHTLNQVYQALISFVEEQFPDDQYLKELAILDYYTYSKLKPQNLFNVEYERKPHFEIVNALKLNHNAFRFAIYDVHFCVATWLNEHQITPKKDVMIIHFNGQDDPMVTSFAMSQATSLIA